MSLTALPALDARRPSIRRVRGVVNAASGSVGPRAAAELEALLAGQGFDYEVADCQPKALEASLQAAVAAKPDLLVVLAGDGTARRAAELCGADGPLLAPLAGGTMNMLPHAIYGARPWRAAAEEVLAHGVERPVSGGEVDGRPFYVAAIVGEPALWASAREAMRKGKLRIAYLRARRALSRALRGRLRYALEDGGFDKCEALTLMCPIVSRAVHDDDALEALVLNPKDAAAAFRLGARTLLSDILGDWRADPAVTVSRCRRGRVRAHGRIPVILDGEPHRLHEKAEIVFRKVAFRALAPAPAASEAASGHDGRAGEASAALGAMLDAVRR